MAVIVKWNFLVTKISFRVLLWTIKILLIKHLFQLEMDWEDDAFLDEDFPEALEEEEEETEVAQFNSTASNFTYEVDLNSGSTIMLSYSSINFRCIFPFFMFSYNVYRTWHP